MIAKARRAGAKGAVFWIFVYLGDRPKRFGDWRGTGDAVRGGWAMVNYDTVEGEIRADQSMTEGFNLEYKMKSTVHELGHAFGLPHMGPDATLRLGNSLMGPNPPAYAARGGLQGDQVYLEAASAAMLWKHPAFAGVAPAVRRAHGRVKLSEYRVSFEAESNSMRIAARVEGAAMPHSAVVIDSRGESADGYWSRSYAGRVGADGRFEIRIADPAKANGVLRMMFCFDDGFVSGDGEHGSFENRGEIRKRYRFADGAHRFER